MKAITKIKRSSIGIDLVRLLAYEGDRIFTTARARELAPRVGLNDNYLCESLFHLRRNGWIVPLRRGLYAVSSTVPGVTSVHEFEIAMALVAGAAISHWSALSHHGLTDSIPRRTFILTTTDVTVPRRRAAAAGTSDRGYTVGLATYQFVQVRLHRFFGIEKVWINESRVSITHLERTLLDGLCQPQYCGGFGEVLHAFHEALPRLDVARIAADAPRLGAATAKRLGWVLEHLDAKGSHLDPLVALPMAGCRLLDPTGPRTGTCNPRWRVRENLAGMP